MRNVSFCFVACIAAIQKSLTVIELENHQILPYAVARVVPRVLAGTAVPSGVVRRRL